MTATGIGGVWPGRCSSRLTWSCACTRDLPAGNRGGSAVERLAVAAPAGPLRAAVAGVVSVAKAALSGAADCRQTRYGDYAAGTLPQSAQSAKSGSHHQGRNPAGGRLGGADHHPRGGDVVGGRRALSLSRSLASRAGVEENEAIPAPQPDTQQTPQSVEATVRTLLMAWALHESTTTLLRTLLRATTSPEIVVVSSRLLSGLGLDTLRQQVQGSWSEVRLQACLPRLRRFLCSRPRLRGIRNPPCEPGWNSEPVHALTDGKRWHEEGVRRLGRAVSTRLWATARVRCRRMFWRTCPAVSAAMSRRRPC